MSSDSPLDTPRDEQRVDGERPSAEEIPSDSLAEDEPTSPLEPQEPAGRRSISPVLPEIPGADLGLGLDLDSILNASNPDPESEKVKKRASNVMKLSQENEKLKEELKAMSDRLEAAERRREQLARKQQHVMESPSS
ncbi:hypothetical protein DFH07DRAFT_838662 [Mycena maculata]|uniref:Uncharacterized protein n=1 Tax=Mycena maculata TaxID=230809 RepID=A0AAD7IFP7_9AGAR|nr:hypothetical protein DFH07DRAFT_838662 [Mycena maculata]